MRRNQSFPLNCYQPKIQHIYKDEVTPYTKVIEYLNTPATIEMPEYGVV